MAWVGFLKDKNMTSNPIYSVAWKHEQKKTTDRCNVMIRRNELENYNLIISKFTILLAVLQPIR